MDIKQILIKGDIQSKQERIKKAKQRKKSAESIIAILERQIKEKRVMLK